MTEESGSVVLIVEDKERTARMYRLYLDDEYEVRVATDGKEGLEKLDHDVDVVLLDRLMPNLSGDEMLAELQSKDIDCRVVMVTAVDPDTDLLDMEFDQYLVKPVEEAELRSAVERMLARDALENQVQDMLAIASKLATLEAKLEPEQLEESGAYQQLLGEFEQLRNEADTPDPEEDYYSEATIEKLQTLLAETHE